MTEYLWADTYTHAVKAFEGETPGRQLEAELIQRFEREPEAVVAAIEKLKRRFADGKIRSPWGLILRELDDDTDRNVKADGRTERARAIHLAERWITNAGLYAPWTEAEAELFDHGGRLHPYDTPPLRDQMRAYWDAQQPRAHQAEADMLERNQKLGDAYRARRPRVAGNTRIPVTNADRLWRTRLTDQPDVPLDHPPPE